MCKLSGPDLRNVCACSNVLPVSGKCFCTTTTKAEARRLRCPFQTKEQDAVKTRLMELWQNACSITYSAGYRDNFKSSYVDQMPEDFFVLMGDDFFD